MKNHSWDVVHTEYTNWKTVNQRIYLFSIFLDECGHNFNICDLIKSKNDNLLWTEKGRATIDDYIKKRKEALITLWIED